MDNRKHQMALIAPLTLVIAVVFCCLTTAIMPPNLDEHTAGYQELIAWLSTFSWMHLADSWPIWGRYIVGGITSILGVSFAAMALAGLINQQSIWNAPN